MVPENLIFKPFKVGLSPHKKFALFASLKAHQNDKKGFLFHLKSSFRSQDICFRHDFLVI